MLLYLPLIIKSGNTRNAQTLNDEKLVLLTLWKLGNIPAQWYPYTLALISTTISNQKKLQVPNFIGSHQAGCTRCKYEHVDLKKFNNFRTVGRILRRFWVVGMLDGLFLMTETSD